MAYAPDEKLLETLFVKILMEKANMLKKHLRTQITVWLFVLILDLM